MGKTFKTYDELLVFLERDKNLIIEDKEVARNILRKIGYFSLISGYKDIFKEVTTGKYVENTFFEDIYLVYQFDGELRSIFLKYILLAERSVKASLAYRFSEVYGENQKEYLSVSNYDYNNRNNQRGIQKLLDILSFQLKSNSEYAYINHYKLKYNNVPLWVMIQAMTLGQVSHMIDYLKATVPIKVCNDFGGIGRTELHSFLSIMTKHRNASAHGERFFNYITKDSIKDTNIHKKLEIQKRNGRYIYGKNDLFSEVIILKYMLDKADFHNFYYELKRCILKHNPSIKIMEMMGFPENWMKILRLKTI